jgi:tetratricopeptide (TPR) repeat protein
VIVLVNKKLQPYDAALSVALWKRPFQVGDAYAFYLCKIAFPIFQVADYARRVDLVLAQWWGYFTWVFPVMLLLFLYCQRRRWPEVWQGSLILYVGLLPTSGIVPYYFHGYSTVADRYLYLPMIGVCLAVSALWLALWQKRKSVQRPMVLITALIALLWAGRSAVDAGYWRDVESLWEHNLALEPKSWLAWNSLAGYYTENGQPDKAMGLYRKAVEANPDSSFAHFNYGVLLGKTGANTQALIQFREAARLAPNDPAVFNSLAATLASEGNLPEALENWRRALQLNPDYVEALVNYGIALAMTGDGAGAIQSWNHALELDPSNVDVRYNLGIALLKQGKRAEAAEQWRLALKVNPNHELSRRELRKLGIKTP